MDYYNINASQSSSMSDGNLRNVNPLLSIRIKDLITFVNCNILCEIIIMFGTLTNIINLVVFCKQGLNSTINISLFSLAISDLACLLLQMIFNIYIDPLFKDLKLPMVYAEVQYLTTAVYREMFARITCLITVYITAERCLCVVFPLHIKQWITPKKTTTIIALIFIITLLSPIPLFCTSYLDWKFFPDKNISLIGIVFAHNKDIAETAVYFMHAVTALLSFYAVVLFTLILTCKLGQKSAWRKNANDNNEKATTMSKRDRSTIVMVIVIASILIMCYTPALSLALITFFVPEFSVGGKYYNLYYSLWTFAQLFENINSSVSMFLYLQMSTRYRQTFGEVFSRYKSSQRRGEILTS